MAFFYWSPDCCNQTARIFDVLHKQYVNPPKVGIKAPCWNIFIRRRKGRVTVMLIDIAELKRSRASAT